ncbi:MAG: Mur ligase family protein, partial [Candidatus Gracilibacteria bacterium]|nr:Mur ligase family protein [Candidatus Gracilibacteria bacterium]
MNFESAVKFLKGFNPYEDKGFPAYTEKNFDLRRFRLFLEAYKLDYRKLACVHIAGSKGKSTTCMIIGNYLFKKGYKVGIFTSPYIVDMTEYIWVNGRSFSKKEFAAEVAELKEFLRDYKGDFPTYFEFLVAVALKIFIENGVDFAVFEVGLGGRLDATNVIESKVAVLTKMEKEHTDILGKTYDKILDEKLGIFLGKKVGELIVAKQSDYVESLIREKIGRFEKAGEIGNVFFVEKEGNLFLAFDVLKNLVGEVDEKFLEKVFQEVRLVGRVDLRFFEGKTVVFDMAHTKNSVRVLIEKLKEKFPRKKFLFLVSIMKNKNVKDVLEPIFDIGDEVVFTSSNFERGYKGEDLQKFVMQNYG